MDQDTDAVPVKLPNGAEVGVEVLAAGGNSNKLGSPEGLRGIHLGEMEIRAVREYGVSLVAHQLWQELGLDNLLAGIPQSRGAPLQETPRDTEQPGCLAGRQDMVDRNDHNAVARPRSGAMVASASRSSTSGTALQSAGPRWVLTQTPLLLSQVAFADDQQPVQGLTTYGSDPAFADGVRARRPIGRGRQARLLAQISCRSEFLHLTGQRIRPSYRPLPAYPCPGRARCLPQSDRGAGRPLSCARCRSQGLA
jgi:hypothetical protein